MLVVTVTDTLMATYALKMKQARRDRASVKETRAVITVKCVVRCTIRSLGQRATKHHGKLTLEYRASVRQFIVIINFYYFPRKHKAELKRITLI